MYNNNPNYTTSLFDGLPPRELRSAHKYNLFFSDLRKGDLYLWSGLIHMIPSSTDNSNPFFKGSTVLILDDFFIVHELGESCSSYVRVLDFATQNIGMVWAGVFYLAKKIETGE